MQSTNQPLSNAALAAYELERDLAADVLQAVREMKAREFSAKDFMTETDEEK
jgi:hypothetical protein